MKKQKHNNILRSIIATFVFSIFLQSTELVSASEIDIENIPDGIFVNDTKYNKSGEILLGNSTDSYLNNKTTIKNTTIDGFANYIEIPYSSSNANEEIKYSYNNTAIINSTINKYIYGGYIDDADVFAKIDLYADNNHLSIIGSKVHGSLYGGFVMHNNAYTNVTNFEDEITNVCNNSIVLENSSVGKQDSISSIYGGYVGHQWGFKNIVSNNKVTIQDCKNDNKIFANIYGGHGYSYEGIYTGVNVEESSDKWIADLHQAEKFEFKSSANDVKIYNSEILGEIKGGSLKTDDAKNASKIIVIGNSVLVDNSITEKNIYGGYGFTTVGDVTSSIDGDGKANDIYIDKNAVKITNTTVNGNIYGGYGTSKNSNIYKGYNAGNVYLTNNEVYIDENSNINGNVYGGFAESVLIDQTGKIGKAVANGNSIILQNQNKPVAGNIKFADLSHANLYGSNLSNIDTKDNDLIIDGWQGKINSANNFNNIKFQNLNWRNEGTVLEIGSAVDSNLKYTNINLISMVGGQNIYAGDYMYIIKSDGMLTTDKNNIAVGQDFTAGVAINGTGEVIYDENGNIKFTVTGTSANDQINLVAENRAVAAAFINQGTDLINDSLDVLSRDSNYGLRTFAAVYGNRSKYDVNSDLKINGWSTIVGIGNKKKISGGDFSWGVFYENGSGNYRTYNEFNNEFFRGDGSLVYNGGGIAARFERDNGVYTEGSLRAGMLKSEMINALKDGAGNSYGYKSESTYYGAHIGVGRVIRLNEAADLDVYGKFFHTYTEGDSFNVAGDKFEFDSITSDRLRIGARLTTNKKNKFSTYYGLAYEYEFNGDANMKAQNMSAPEQSLKGSSCMAEIGTNYKPSIESPWSLDLSMRGYAGQCDGFSGNVQVTYSF